MTYVVLLLVALSAGLLTAAGVAGLVGGQERAVQRELTAIRHGGLGVHELRERRRRQARSDRLRTMLEALGGKPDQDDKRVTAVRWRLQRAGFRNPKATAYYYASRTLAAAAMGAFGLMVAGVVSRSVVDTSMIAAACAIVGWMLPSMYLRTRTRRRQDELARALPDALDLLVVCVEAGLGLNQALLRVGDEIDHLSRAMSDEIMVVSLELRAGAPRTEALRNLAKRTGVADIQALVGMLIQTERFGTSVARGLRVHSHSLRTKRRQRAEEAAAKTSIRMLFPLVLFIFPAMLVVILGPAGFHLAKMFGAQ